MRKLKKWFKRKLDALIDLRTWVKNLTHVCLFASGFLFYALLVVISKGEYIHALSIGIGCLLLIVYALYHRERADKELEIESYIKGFKQGLDARDRTR